MHYRTILGVLLRLRTVMYHWPESVKMHISWHWKIIMVGYCSQRNCSRSLISLVQGGKDWIQQYPNWERNILWPWWCHQMKTFSALLSLCAGNSPVTSDIPTQRPVKRSIDVFFDLHLNKRFKLTFASLVIWNAIGLIMRSPQWLETPLLHVRLF